MASSILKIINAYLQDKQLVWDKKAGIDYFEYLKKIKEEIEKEKLRK